MVHIVINNEAHETVGGMPTVSKSMDFVEIARGCGYPYATCVNTFEDLDVELKLAKDMKQLCLIEVKCSIGARSNLGRPTTTAIENKKNFMEHLSDF